MGRARQKAPSEEFDPAIEELATLFGVAASAIAAEISAEAAAQITSAGIGALARLDELAEDIAVALGSLLSVSREWSEDHVANVYRRGAQQASAAVEGEIPAASEASADIDRPEDDIADAIEGPDAGPQDPHEVAIQAARDKIDAELESAIQGMSADANRELSEIRRRSVSRALAQDSPLGDRGSLADDFADTMRERGIRFQDKSGREWESESYARMVLRTNVAAVLNSGHLNKALELGSRYVRVTDGGPGDVDEPCKRANGQIWHILYAALHMLEHPNCRRSFAALDPSYDGPVDRDLDALELAA